MKLAKLFLASSLVASCAFAEGAFVGVVGGYDRASYDVVDGYNTPDLDSAGHLVIGVKGGYDYGNSRMYAQYNYKAKDTIYEDVDVEIKAGAHKFIVGYDWTPSLSESVKFSVGPYLGYSRLNLKDSDGDSDDQNGYVVGAKLGMIFDFGVGELEAGAKADYSRHASSNDFVDFDAGTVGGYIGYNSKF